MIRIIHRSLPLLATALALAGCVAYPSGYGGYGYAPGYYAPSVAVAVPCCRYGNDYGYRRW